MVAIDTDGQRLLHVRRGQCTRRKCPFEHDGAKDVAATGDTPPAPPTPPALAIRPTGDPTYYSPAARAVQRGRTQFSVLHEDKA